MLSESALLSLWSDCPPRPSSTGTHHVASNTAGTNAPSTENFLRDVLCFKSGVAVTRLLRMLRRQPTKHSGKKSCASLAQKRETQTHADVLAKLWARPPVDDGRSGQSDHGGKKKKLSTFQRSPERIHHKQCFEIDVPPIAKRVSNNNADTVATFSFCVSTLAICDSMWGPRAVVTPEELSCVAKPVVTSQSWLMHDESARVSETKLHKGNALKTRCSLATLHERAPCSVFSRSVVTAALKQLMRPTPDVAGVIEGLGGHQDESAAALLQDSEPKLAKESQLSGRHEFQSSPTTTDTDAELAYVVVVRSRNPFGLTSFAGAGLAYMSSTLFLPEESNQPTHRWYVGPTGSSTQ